VPQKIHDEKAAVSFAVAVLLQLAYGGPLMVYRLLKELDMPYVNKSFSVQDLDLTLSVLQQK
jgi:hypothetical protein